MIVYNFKKQKLNSLQSAFISLETTKPTLNNSKCERMEYFAYILQRDKNK